MSKTKLTSGEISSLCMEMSLLLHAGLNLADGLRLLLEDAERENHGILSGMAERTDGGKNLSDAMRESGAFPEYVCGLTECGERTGRAEEALRALSEYYDGRERLENRIRSALLYPAVLLLLMLVVIGVLLAKVLPVFNEVFASLGGQFTGLAGGLLALGEALDTAMPALLVLLALAAALLAAFAGSDRFREWMLRRWRVLCGGRGISRKISQARLAQAMAMGLLSGLPAGEALELSASLQKGHPDVMRRYLDCRARLERDGDLAGALKESGLLPPGCCRMIALGIRSGSGDSVMQEIARRLEEESGTAIEEKVGRVEPSLVIATSILVGVILLSVMLPLMHILAAIG
jgi:type IV pilus assembly protein PilC